MIGDIAFCPKTGARFSEKRHYGARGKALHVPVADAFVTDEELDGELTAGVVRSSRRALLTHFRRTHQYYFPADGALYRDAALGLWRLKRTASGRGAGDVTIWLALSVYLRERGHETAWMGGHVSLRCPRCDGRLAYEQFGAEVSGRCGTNCTDDSADRLREITETAASLAARTFDSMSEDEATLVPEEFYGTSASGREC